MLGKPRHNDQHTSFIIELRFRIKLPLPASMADKLLCGGNQLDPK